MFQLRLTAFDETLEKKKRSKKIIDLYVCRNQREDEYKKLRTANDGMLAPKNQSTIALFPNCDGIWKWCH